MVDYDSPWKEALDEYLQAFVALFFPAMHDEIDWQRGYETLDKELQQITPDAEQGRRFVDKLVQVWRTSGEAEWVLIHIEVQGQEEAAFAQRMFVYNCRLAERYNKSVVSVAVLADESPAWLPTLFRRELWGCSTEFRFPTAKLLAYTARSDELEASDNPFAWFVLAHVKALENKRDDQSRYVWKLRLVRSLFERGLSADEIRKLFRLIDWVLTLPAELALQFKGDLTTIQEEKHMPYVTSIERLAKEEGLEQGREEGLEQGREEGLEQGREEGLEQGREEGLKLAIIVVLNVRFGEIDAELKSEIESVRDRNLLQVLLQRASQVAASEELRECWR